MRSYLIAPCIFVATLSGCAVYEMHKDQDLLRGTLLKLYTDQVLDNLIRASSGLPIIQIDYSSVGANVTVDASVTGGDSNTATHVSMLTMAAAKTAAITRTALNTIMGGASATNTNIVSLTGNPVLSSDEVYNAYLEYLGIPGSLQKSCGPPPDGTAHIWKRCNDWYYWVPLSFQKQFFDLAMITTAQRDRLLLPPDEYFHASIMAVTYETPKPQSTQVYALIQINKLIPNDSGYVLFNDGGGNDNKGTRLSFVNFVPSKNERLFSTGRLRVEVTGMALPFHLKDLKDLAPLPMAVAIHLDNNAPPPPTTRELLDRIPFSVPQVELMPGSTSGTLAGQSGSMNH
jgi:hypothetical protein